LVAENLNAQAIFASDLLLDLPTLHAHRFVTGIVLARLFDLPEFRREVAEALKPKLTNAARVGFPAVLGLRHAIEATHDLEERLGIPVFEIPGLPPSIPGIRLHNLLFAAIEKHGGQVFDGMQVNRAEIQQGTIVAVYSQAAARHKPHYASSFILATGGILGGGTITSNLGYAQDAALDLPIPVSPDRTAWTHPEFLSTSPHPIYQAGLAVDSHFRPLDPDSQPLYRNLYAIGSALAGCDPLRERSLEGIALTTGYLVGKEALP
jgi:glycerol-3-phosphate dehydrogenase subunit B